MQWENVYIFISSTFNDMHAERDYLVKKVFPHLSAWCEERKLKLVDIDLRWGVSEADATQNKRVVQVCLDRIDACRPFFLCFLGQRRGWVPSISEIGSATYKNYSKLTGKYAGSASVTEMEMLHALIDPLHNGILHLADGSSQTAEPAKHAFFFMRQPDYLAKIQSQALRNIYTNEAEADPAKADAELARWREEIIPQTGRPVFDYSASWQENESTHEIALPLYVPTTAPIGSDTWNTAFSRWAKTWENVGVKVGDNGKITDKTELSKAKAYNESFTKGRLGNFNHDGADLAEIIVEQLKAALTERFGERVEQAQTPLQHELDQQAQFLQVASEGFIERTGDLDKVNGYLADGEIKPLAIAAYAGMGKTSLLAHFIDTYQSEDEKESLHYRFIGGSDDSVSVERLLRSLLSELKEAGKITSIIPANTMDMLNKLPELFAEAGQNGKTILVIDALNQLESGMSNLSWIPAALPENIKLIVSFKRGEPAVEDYYSQLKQNNAMIFSDVKPFDSMSDRKKLVTAYLDRYFKELDEPRIQALIGSDGSNNPLFLKIVLSELRVFGVHNDLSAMIMNNFGNTPVLAFSAVLTRMESDPAYTKLAPGISLPHVFGWLAHSKYGLSVEELTDLLIREKLTDNTEDAHDAIYIILRQLRPYLAKRDGRIDFFYESFKIAATERYTQSHPCARAGMNWHKSLAEYFEALPLTHRHKLMEQAWQYAMAGLGEKLKALLWDYTYLDTKLKTFDANTLVAEYELISLVPLSAEDIQTLELMQDCLRLSAHVLAIHKDQLAPQLWGRMAGFPQLEIKTILQQAADEKKEPWIRPRSACMEKPGSGLIRTFEGYPENVYSAVFCPDGEHILSGGRGYKDNIRLWDIQTGFCIKTLDNGYHSADNIKISSDGKYALSECNQVWGKRHLAITLLDLQAWSVIRSFSGGTWFITCTEFSRDNKYILMGSTDNTVRIWDIESTECLKEIFMGVEISAEKVTWSADCKYIFLKQENGIIKIWDIEAEKCVQTTEHDIEKERAISVFEGNAGKIIDTAISPDHKYILSCSTDNIIKLWRTETGECIKTFKAHADMINSINFSPDGKFAVTASSDHTVKLWNIDSYIKSSNIDESSDADIKNRHINDISCIDLSIDSRRALTGSADNTIKMWDLVIGKYLKTFIGHKNYVESVAFRADGKYALSSGNGQVLLWNIADGKCIRTYKTAEYLGGNAIFSPDGKYAISHIISNVYEFKDFHIIFFDIDTGKCERILKGHTKSIVSLSLSRGGKHLLSASYDNTVRLWNMETGKCTKKLNVECEKDKRIRRLGARVDFEKSLNRLRLKTQLDLSKETKNVKTELIGACLSLDGERVFTYGQDKVFRVWKVKTGKRLKEIKFDTQETAPNEFIRAALGANDRYLLSYTTREQFIRLWDMELGECFSKIYFDGSIEKIAYSADGLSIVAGNASGDVFLLCLENPPYAREQTLRSKSHN